MKSILFVLTLAIFLVQITNAQRSSFPRQVAQAVQEEKKHGVVFHQVQLATPVQGPISKAVPALKSGAIVDHYQISSTAIAGLIIDRPEFIQWSLPTKQGNQELELERNEFMTADMVIRSSGGTIPFDQSTQIHYKGQVAGNANSLVALSVFQGEMAALIIDQNGTSTFGKIADDPQQLHILYKEDDLIRTSSWSCGAVLPPDVTMPGVSAAERSAQTTNCVRYTWEADHDLYLNKGSVNAVAQYLIALFNQSNIIFANDGISVLLTELVIWDVPSPYTGNDSFEMLDSFGNLHAPFLGDLAHLITLQSSYGGRAWIGTYCSQNSYFKTAFSGIQASYSNYPVYSYPVFIVTHEQGHNLGSRHTHDCVWNGNNTAIDGCGPNAGYMSEAGTCPTEPEPLNGGTIMSYCNLRPVGTDLSLGFGPQPTALIVNNVNSASCLNTCATAPGNGNCNTAEVIPMLEVGQCVAATGGLTLAGAIQSMPAEMLCGQPGVDGMDVWFQFRAICVEHEIQVIPSTWLDPVVAVYPTCGGAALACENSGAFGTSEQVALSGLTPGTDYLIRVYVHNDAITAGSLPITPEFSLCVNTQIIPACTSNCPDPALVGQLSSTTAIIGQPYHMSASYMNDGTVPTGPSDSLEVYFKINGDTVGTGQFPAGVAPGTIGPVGGVSFVFDTIGTYLAEAALQHLPGQCDITNDLLSQEVVVCDTMVRPVTVSGDTTLCAGSVGFIYVEDPQPQILYRWDLSSPSDSFMVDHADTILLQGQDRCGNFGQQQTIIITEIPSETATITGPTPTPLCFNDPPVILTGTVSGPGGSFVGPGVTPLGYSNGVVTASFNPGAGNYPITTITLVSDASGPGICEGYDHISFEIGNHNGGPLGAQIMQLNQRYVDHTYCTGPTFFYPSCEAPGQNMRTLYFMFDPTQSEHTIYIEAISVSIDAVTISNGVCIDEVNNGEEYRVSGLTIGQGFVGIQVHTASTTDGYFAIMVSDSVGLRAQVAVDVLLDGPYDQGSGLMNDMLRGLPDMPLTEPYSALGYTHVHSGGETLDPNLLNNTGATAIVDWMFLDLRPSNNISEVISTAVGLLQRNGRIIGADGGPLYFDHVAPTNYYIGVWHRNHLPVVSGLYVDMHDANGRLNLRDGWTPAYGPEAMKEIGGKFLLWGGDVNGDLKVQYSGSGNDRDPVLVEIGGSVPTNVITGYRTHDVNLNGQVKYAGQGNDRDRIFTNIGGVVPTDIRHAQMP